MPNYKIYRIQEDLKREITNILNFIKDPRVSRQIITIVKISLSADMSYAKVYISSLDGIKGAEKAVKGLESAKGLIKHKISERLNLRKIPELQFFADNSIENSMNMFKKIEN